MTRKAKTLDRKTNLLGRGPKPEKVDELFGEILQEEVPRNIEPSSTKENVTRVSRRSTLVKVKPEQQRKGQEKTLQKGEPAPSLDVPGPSINRPKHLTLKGFHRLEEKCETLHQTTVGQFKRLLCELQGFKGSTKEERQDVARRVTKLAHRLGLVLLAQDDDGHWVPVTLRCTRQSFEVRKSGGKLAGIVDAIPQLQVVSRESLTSSLYER